MTVPREQDLTEARFSGAVLEDSRVRGVEPFDVEIGGELKYCVVNGVGVAALVEAESDRRSPEGTKVPKTTATGSAKRGRYQISCVGRTIIANPSPWRHLDLPWDGAPGWASSCGSAKLGSLLTRCTRADVNARRRSVTSLDHSPMSGFPPTRPPPNPVGRR